MDYFFSLFPQVAEGLNVTLIIFFVTLIFSMPLGVLVALIRISPLSILSKLMYAYIYVMRGTPLLLQIVVIYFGLPFIPVVGPYLRLDAMPAALIAFILNYAAYFAEIFRGGIQSISKGQYEAAKVLGLTYVQTMRRIILPQVLKRVLPPVANETITLLKDTALVYILAMNDVLRIAQNVVQRDFDITAFAVAGIFYLVMTFVLTQLSDYLERRFAVYDE